MPPRLYLFLCYFIMIYQDSWNPVAWALESTNKFEILNVKIFSLKQKNKYFRDYRKNQIFSPQENSIIFLQTISFVEISNHTFK